MGTQHSASRLHWFTFFFPLEFSIRETHPPGTPIDAHSWAFLISTFSFKAGNEIDCLRLLCEPQDREADHQYGNALLTCKRNGRATFEIYGEFRKQLMFREEASNIPHSFVFAGPLHARHGHHQLVICAPRDQAMSAPYMTATFIEASTEKVFSWTVTLFPAESMM